MPGAQRRIRVSMPVAGSRASTRSVTPSATSAHGTSAAGKNSSAGFMSRIVAGILQ